MTTSEGANAGVLAGYRVIELEGLGPAPYCGQLLADMGADVVVVERPGADRRLLHNRGKRSIVLDLRKPGAADVVVALARGAHMFIEGLRPGVAERLGVGPDAIHAVNPKLVYGRMTGWGQSGPWAKMAGHDINYISITGALYAIGEDGRVPPPPLNLVGDFGGGSLFLLSGLLGALLKAERTGKGDIVDAAIIDGVHSLMGMMHSFAAIGLWSTKRESNPLDGGTPYYRCYRTKDDGFMAVGCIEPQFFAEMLRLLNLSAAEYGTQNDVSLWPAQHALLEATFAQKTRAEWAALFDGTEACVTPVLDYQEARAHPQNVARASLIAVENGSAPGPAPRFSASHVDPSVDIAPKGAHAHEILSQAGFTAQEIEALTQSGALVN